MGYTISAIERLAKKFFIANNGCWEWIGAKTAEGYGTAVVSYKQTSAHRHLYQSVHGLLPKNIQLDHLCKNKGCVNPKHLEPVTAHENLMRSDSMSAINNRKIQCINGHEFSENNTYYRWRKNRRERDCKTCRKDAVYRFNLKKGVQIGLTQRIT